MSVPLKTGLTSVFAPKRAKEEDNASLAGSKFLVHGYKNKINKIGRKLQIPACSSIIINKNKYPGNNF